MFGTPLPQGIPIVFECRREQLLGIAHLPGNSARFGVLLVVDGPQYRVGSYLSPVGFTGPDACIESDHTFSPIAWRDEVVDCTLAWTRGLDVRQNA